VLRRLREILALPSTAARWWRRTTTAPAAEQWLLLVGLPLLLVATWLAGLETRFAFRLNAEWVWDSSRTLLTAFTANYVHFGGRHLFDNLLNYWVTLFAIYPLVAIAGWNRQFRLSVVTYLLAAPFGIAVVTLAVLNPSTEQFVVGFSGIVAALLGFLPVVLAAAASEQTDGAIAPSWAVVPVLFSVALVFAVPSVSYVQPQSTLAVGVGVTGVAVAGVLWSGTPTRQLRTYGRQLSPDVRLAFLIGSTVFVFGVAGALVFVHSGTNVWGHLSGYLIGFTIPYLAFVIRPLLIRSVPK